MTAPKGIVLGAAFLLFLMWSNSFVANSFLLGSDSGVQRLDWVGLTLVRFIPSGALVGLYLLVFRHTECLELFRRFPGRLAVCGLLGVPSYNFALSYAQQEGVSAPIASLTTALVPLFVMVLSALFLGERITGRRILGFVIAVTGMLIIATSKKTGIATGYAWLIGLTALAPLAWSSYSVISKPIMRRHSPIVWSYLATTIGSLTLLPLLPGPVWRQAVGLDLAGWMAIAYLVGPCTIAGFAIWTWLLKQLPASTVGLTVFLNPPLTTASKAILAATLPAVFAFTITGQEWIGGAIVLAGLAVALSQLAPEDRSA